MGDFTRAFFEEEDAEIGFAGRRSASCSPSAGKAISEPEFPAVRGAVERPPTNIWHRLKSRAGSSGRTLCEQDEGPGPKAKRSAGRRGKGNKEGSLVQRAVGEPWFHARHLDRRNTLIEARENENNYMFWRIAGGGARPRWARKGERRLRLRGFDISTGAEFPH